MLLRTAFATFLSAAVLDAAALQAVHAQSADLVLCDRIAADPADPDKPKDVKGAAQIEPSDIPTAIKFCRAASASSRRAMHALGRAYAANRQMPEAIAAWRKASDKGSTAAMIDLGLALSGGGGGTKDQEQGRAWLERAAQAGDPRAIAHLMTQGGSGTAPSDPVKARAMFSAAAERNSAEAQFQLGIMSAEGVGGPKDDAAARALFEKAAAQNHPGALEWLGAFAYSGRGGLKDEAAAKTYYERAAALGNPNAKTALERLRCPYVLKNKQGEVWSNLCF